MSSVAVEDLSTWPSFERVILPTRALLMSWLIQTLPMRRAALADSVTQAQALADEPPGAARDLAVLAVVSDAMQPLEDFAYLATSWSEPLRGLPYYVRATMYSDRTPTNFWRQAHKRDDVFLDVLAGSASPRPDTGEVADVLDTFQAIGSVPDDQANAAMQHAREATRRKLRMPTTVLGVGCVYICDVDLELQQRPLRFPQPADVDGPSTSSSQPLDTNNGSAALAAAAPSAATATASE